eukprot:gnl/MRDRNA2_/MRDRNA2_102082_c0_seq1.p1 gnl/MRDRNA2_/MRDRNA2_102082_c0~~gnl/MRDRNA2_/MRDRNA2_102082_c0_seq1.p1  ORF type:complete len:142 (+),score=25.55 gnl/MRDRNA2_/MRDRNA2_102082_c0_seq1:86-511(+)
MVSISACVGFLLLASVQGSVGRLEARVTYGDFLMQTPLKVQNFHEGAQNKVGPAASVAAGEGPAAEYAQASYNAWLISTLFSIAVFVISTYLVWKWHNEMREKGEGPQCGWKSILCCLCCTVATICFPIDEGRKYDDVPRQ